jgi:hypothetical protein
MSVAAYPGMAAFPRQTCNGVREETGTIMGRMAHPIGVVLAVLICLPIGQAAAQEYCVSCSGPNALYRCVIDGAQPRGGQPLQMLCITAMAKDGGHATCSVKRGSVFECDGPVKRVPWAALNGAAQTEGPTAQPWAPETAPKPEPAARPMPAPTSAPAASPGPEAPPQTVLELAKRTNEKTAEQMKKAGDTVKEATKKTWDCMASFFTRC